MKYQIVTHKGSEMVDDIRAWAMEHGHPYLGLSSAGGYLRPELQNQPKFRALAGPMYGGEGIVRYEDWQTYRELSA